MPRRGENIYKRKDGRWEGRYAKSRHGGKIKYGYVYAKTYKEVKNKLASVSVPGAFVDGKETGGENVSFNDEFSKIAAEWLDSLKPQLKESSIVKYSNILKNHLLPAFCGKRISDIKRDDIAELSSRMLLSGGRKKDGLSPKTVSCVLAALKSIFSYASRTKNFPLADVSGIFVKQPQKPMQILSRAEQQKLSHYLCGHLTLCNLGILLCLYTGLRVGEICALKWEDISFDEQILRVEQTMQRIQKPDDGEKKTEVLVSAPKSDCSIRKIPIPDEIFQFIADAKHPGDTYFLTGMTCKYMEPRTMQNRFKAVAKKCGIENVHFHMLRHTFATRCVELGFDVKSLSEILGHASVNITLNRYVHPSMELKQQNMNRLGEAFAVK